MSAASISSSQNQQHDNRQAELIKACVSGQIPLVRSLLNASSISSAASGSLTAPWTTASEKDTLRLSLQRAAARGNLEIVQLLLGHNAEIEPKYDPKKGDEVGSLFRAAEMGHTPIVEELLSKGANLENARDRFGRWALTVAAMSGHTDTVLALIKGGAHPDWKDREGRTTLLYLASEKSYAPAKPATEQKPTKGQKMYPINEKILYAIVEADSDLEARDSTFRTPLIWAAVNGKTEFVKFLLEGLSEHKRVVIDASNDKGRSALHFAAESDFEGIVELLLKHHATTKIASEGGWTALHNAAQKGNASVVEMLLNAGAPVNAELSNGKTALHWAAQNGHRHVANVLLKRPDTKLFVKDSYERTPIICAAENGHDDIVQMLSPGKTGSRLSAEARFACNNFKATIVDFGLEGQPKDKSQRVMEVPVYDLLYGWDSVHERSKVPSLIKNMKIKPAFRWIHIPHNNVAWVEAMLTKNFVEAGHREIAEFKALEKCFSQEHRGSTAHSSFMRTYAQRIQPVDYRQPTFSTPGEKHTKPGGMDGNVIQEENALGIIPTPAITVEPSTPLQGSLDTLGDKDKRREAFQKGNVQQGTPGGKKKKADKHAEKKAAKEEGLKKVDSKGNGGGKGTPSKKQGNQKGDARKDSLASKLSKEPAGKLVLFMPFLHYESDLYRARMSKAINKASILNPPLDSDGAPIPSALHESGPTTPDDMLIKAYLNPQPGNTQPGLHPRRTLDQFFYHGIDTAVRDQDQVVYRYCKARNIEMKVFMVDQLWMWILGKDLIVTCFPQRWQQPPNDPLNVLKGIIEDIDVKANRTPVKSVYDLAMVITSRCSGIFDRHRLDDEDYQFVEMFESSLGHLTNEETRLFDRFNRASGKATKWLKEHRRSRTRRVLMGSGEEGEFDDPTFVDTLLDIRVETSVLLEIKDIRDELNIIKMVLQNQLHILPDFAEHVSEEQGGKKSLEAMEVRKKLKDQIKIIEVHIKDLNRMDKQAELIYNSVSIL
jgi:ankyrin repeat protein